MIISYYSTLMNVTQLPVSVHHSILLLKKLLEKLVSKCAAFLSAANHSSDWYCHLAIEMRDTNLFSKFRGDNCAMENKCKKLCNRPS